MTRMRSHSTPCALIERHYSTGDVIVVLDSLTRALTATRALLNLMRRPEINTPLTRYPRSPRLNSSPDHTRTDHYPVSKSP